MKLQSFESLEVRQYKDVTKVRSPVLLWNGNCKLKTPKCFLNPNSEQISQHSQRKCEKMGAEFPGLELSYSRAPPMPSSQVIQAAKTYCVENIVADESLRNLAVVAEQSWANCTQMWARDHFAR